MPAKEKRGPLSKFYLEFIHTSDEEYAPGPGVEDGRKVCLYACGILFDSLIVYL